MKVSINSKVSVELLAERALLWDKNLVVADLHWGKSETFQLHGIPVPSNLLEIELSRLLLLAKKRDISRVIILGDLVHSVRTFGEETLSQTSNFFKNKNFDVLLIEGNHDRQLKLPADWDVEVVREPYYEKRFAFCHHPDVLLPEERGDHYVWAGHLHPTVLLRRAKDRLRLPCFVLGKSVGIVPAFSDFTRGVMFSSGLAGLGRRSPQKNDQRLYAIADEEVIEL